MFENAFCIDPGGVGRGQKKYGVNICPEKYQCRGNDFVFRQ